MSAGLLARPFDLRLPLGRGLLARVTGGTGRAERLALVETLRPLAARVLGGGALGYGLFQDDGAGLERHVVTVLSDRATGRAVAFNVLPVLTLDWPEGSEDVLHLGLVMVDPAARGRGLTTALYGLAGVVMFLRGGARPLLVSSVTQVPAVFGMVATTYGGVFPGARPRPTFRQTLVARRIMAHHRAAFGVGPEARFDERRFVVEDGYRGGSEALKKSWADAPRHRDERHNDWMRGALDYERGDDVLQLGEIDLGAAQTVLRRHLPRGSVPGLLALGALEGVRALVLPALHWFDTSRPLGELAARGGR